MGVSGGKGGGQKGPSDFLEQQKERLEELKKAYNDWVEKYKVTIRSIEQLDIKIKVQKIKLSKIKQDNTRWDKQKEALKRECDELERKKFGKDP